MVFTPSQTRYACLLARGPSYTLTQMVSATVELVLWSLGGRHNRRRDWEHPLRILLFGVYDVDSYTYSTDRGYGWR